MMIGDVRNWLNESKQPEPVIERLDVTDYDAAVVFPHGEEAAMAYYDEVFGSLETRRDEILASGNITEEAIEELAEIQTQLDKE